MKKPSPSPTPSIEMVNTSVLRVFPGNAKLHDIKAIERSIQEVGWFGTLIVNKNPVGVYGNNTILKGNGSYTAACNLGITELPCLMVNVSDGKAIEINLADNRINELRGNDPNALMELITLLIADGGDPVNVGYEQDDMEEINRLINPPPPEVKVKSPPDRKLISTCCPACAHAFVGELDMKDSRLNPLGGFDE